CAGENAAPSATVQDGVRWMESQGERGAFRLGPEDRAGSIEIVAVGREPLDALLAGLRGVVEIALMGDPAALTATRNGTSSVPIRGRGGDLAATFGQIAAETLGQLDDHGAGFAHVRVDGMLTADDGGYSAWGYLIGEGGWPSPAPLELAGPAQVEADGEGRVLLRCTLRRLGAR
ncbi:MAG: hypothetical protein ACR2J8_02910, partial [Thermomicrobiales bacterium]